MNVINIQNEHSNNDVENIFFYELFDFGVFTPCKIKSLYLGKIKF